MAGLRELLVDFERCGIQAIKGWVMVFESRLSDVEEQDWRDGYEELTARRDGLRPGVVVEVRRKRPGDDELRREGPRYRLPQRSMLRDKGKRHIARVGEVCAAIEAMLSRAGHAERSQPD